MNKSEKLILKAFLNMPSIPILNHELELEESFLAGYVTRFLKGERFDKIFVAFSEEEEKLIQKVLNQSIEIQQKIDLKNKVMLTKLVCNILNKYKK